MSISKSTPIASAQEDNHVAKETCTVYTVACDDSNGTRAEVFCFEGDALRWLAETPRAPTSTRGLNFFNSRMSAMTRLLAVREQSPEDFATYRVESHDLQLQPNLFLAETHPKLLPWKALNKVFLKTRIA
jgi:hypothetical protein